MKIHALMDSSTVNGPGRRAVIWTQGCQGMSCAEACWNRKTHDAGAGREMDPLDIMQWLAPIAHDLEGITVSGGEPMQQAREVGALINGVRLAFPELSIGLFSGYSEKELAAGKYASFPTQSDEYRRGHWAYLTCVLDFAILGRYNPDMPSKKPLRTSRNQQLMLYSSRYKLKDFQRQAVQVSIKKDGLTTITGFPTGGAFSDL